MSGKGKDESGARLAQDLRAWQARALYLLLAVLAVGGLLAYGSTILDAFIRRQMTPLLWVYVGVYVSFLLVAVLPRLSIPLRAWSVFILAYANAAASLARVGLPGSGRLYLVFVPVAAVILLGSRAGWTCLGVSLGLYSIFAVLAGRGVLVQWLTMPENPVAGGFWIEAGATLALFLVLLTLLVDRFFARHVTTLEASEAVTAELGRAYGALERRVEQRTRELDLLNSVAGVVSGLGDIGEVLRAALRKTMDAFDIEAGSAYGLEQASGTLVMLAHAGLSASFAASMERLSLEAALAGKQLSMERPVSWIVDDYPEGDLRTLITGEGLKSIIAVPLAAKGKLVGGLVLDSRRERALTAEEGTLLIAVGRQIGLAMENARLLESEREGHEDADRRREVAEGLRETLAVLNSHRPLEEILQFIVSQACRMTGSDATSLMQMEPPDGSFRIRASCGLDREHAAAVRYTRGHGGPGRALEARQPVAVPDVEAFVQWQIREANPEYAEELRGLQLMLGRGFRANLSVPLIVRGEGFGGITLYYRKARQFSDDEVQLATSLADQASLAVENARLHEEAEAAAALAERNRLARELHDSVTQSLYSVTLYAEAAARLLGAGQAAEAASHLRDLGTTAREALREMRLLIFELNPPALEKGNLSDAIQIRLDAVESRGGVAVSFHVEGTERLTPLLRQELYQITQEALNNTLKHAHAQAVKVRLQFSDRETVLEVSDDGAGFDPEKGKRGGLGLRGMRERVQKCGGSLAVESHPGQGTRVRVCVPAIAPGPGGPQRGPNPAGPNGA
jgi:signal transduction histidine kinase